VPPTDDKIPSFAAQQERARRAPKYDSAAVDRMVDDAGAAAKKTWRQRLRRAWQRVRGSAQAFVAWWRARLPERAHLAQAATEQLQTLSALLRRKEPPAPATSLAAHACFSVWTLSGAALLGRSMAALLFEPDVLSLIAVVPLAIGSTALGLVVAERNAGVASRGPLFVGLASVLSAASAIALSAPAWHTPAAPLPALLAIADCWLAAIVVARFAKHVQSPLAALVYPVAGGVSALVVTIFFLRTSTPPIEATPEEPPAATAPKPAAPRPAVEAKTATLADDPPPLKAPAPSKKKKARGGKRR
jgi:hypothetical protein